MAGEWTLPGLGNDLLTSEKFGLRRLKTESSLIVNNGLEASVQNPLPTDGDSVYAKDIWIEESDITGWTGLISDLFDNLHTVITNNSSTNPKSIFIHFKRTIVCNTIGIGSFTGNFSNVRIGIINSGGIETIVYNDSGNNTKQTNQTIQLPITAGFNAIKIYFHTVDPVSISNLVILKTINTVARLQAKKPDSTVTDINATAGGNLKVSLEEYENTFLTAPLPVRIIDSRTGRESEIDVLTFGLVTIDTEHHEVHEGNHFYFCDYQLNNTSGAVINLSVTTPSSGKRPHVAFTVFSSLGATIEVYNGATVTGGTTITPLNNMHGSAITSALAVKLNPTITVAGTRRSGYLAGAGRQAGIASRSEENILAYSTTYVFKITSLANSNDISWCFEWYEHTE